MAIAHANRGIGLETLIEYANNQYASKGIAVIQKIATPWKVVRKGKNIVSAFPDKKSTIDFMGVYQTRAIAFEAKRTELKTRFPLANIEKHQLEFMQKWQEQGGISFFLIEFKAHQEIYIVPLDEMIAHVRSHRESIPYKYFYNHGTRVGQSDGVVLNYLKEIKLS